MCNQGALAPPMAPPLAPSLALVTQNTSLDSHRQGPKCMSGHCHPSSWPSAMAPCTIRLSRNLWQEVTHYLRLGDIDAATEQKRRLEERQRVEERKRETLRTPWRPKYFIPEVSLACYQALVLIKVTSTFIVETVGQTGPHRTDRVWLRLWMGVGI